MATERLRDGYELLEQALDSVLDTNSYLPEYKAAREQFKIQVVARIYEVLPEEHRERIIGKAIRAAQRISEDKGVWPQGITEFFIAHDALTEVLLFIETIPRWEMRRHEPTGRHDSGYWVASSEWFDKCKLG